MLLGFLAVGYVVGALLAYLALMAVYGQTADFGMRWRAMLAAVAWPVIPLYLFVLCLWYLFLWKD